jgi:signal transduction histidine kinase
LAELVQDNVQRFHIAAEERGVALRADYDPALPRVVADLGLLERALQNLVENALRYTPERGTVTVALDRLEANGHVGPRVEVRVSDTGCGIAAEDMPYIFERFYQPHQERAAGNGAGVGLGLAIARRILELHGSRIEAVSEPERGATFTFHLPVPA